MTLWAFLSQVLHAQRLRSCAAAVPRVIVLCVALGRQPPSPDTGAYCRARAKLPETVLTRLVYGTADQLESRVPADWLWRGRHVKAGDGTTLLTPDTPENQAAWPQPKSQKPGLGFPILRMVVLFSLAYNLVRKTIAQAALVHEKLPRHLSFAAALAAVATSWDHATLATQKVLTALAEAQFRVIAWHQVGDRPDRVEPRAVKRRPKPHRLLRQPRAQARAALCGRPPGPVSLRR